MNRLLLSSVCGLGITFGLIVIGVLAEPLRAVSELLLAPGYALPRAYRGGAHDPVQILVAIVFNCVFYGCVVYVVSGFRRVGR